MALKSIAKYRFSGIEKIEEKPLMETGPHPPRGPIIPAVKAWLSDPGSGHSSENEESAS